MFPALVLIAASYVLGSIPFGLMAGKIRGMDVRHHGSGNIGATNVFRVLGKGWGIVVFLLDAGKGFGAVYLASCINSHLPDIFMNANVPALKPLLPEVAAQILGGIWAIIGHTFPLWLGFRGGKGVATSLGVVLALVPLAAGVGMGVWVLTMLLTRYVAIASMVGALAVPATVAFYPANDEKWPLFTLAAVAAFLIVWRHRTNIERLVQGTEHRFGKPRPSP